MTNEEGRIVVAGLTKTYGTLRAVDGLSFTVEPGTITGFLGPNGAGKTTTLRMLARPHHPRRRHRHHQRPPLPRPPRPQRPGRRRPGGLRLPPRP